MKEGCVLVVFLVVVLGTVLLLVGVLSYNIYLSALTDTVTGTVIEKFVDEGNVYFTIEKDNGATEVLSNNDSIIHGKYNSRDLVSKIVVGERYTFKVNCKRVPFLGMHHNILTIE